MDASIRAVPDVARPDGAVLVRKRALDQVNELVARMPVQGHLSAGVKLDKVRLSPGFFVRPQGSRAHPRLPLNPGDFVDVDYEGSNRFLNSRHYRDSVGIGLCDMRRPSDRKLPHAAPRERDRMLHASDNRPIGRTRLARIPGP